MRTAHSQDCLSSMMEPTENLGTLPTMADFTVAQHWVWTRSNGEKVTLGSLTRKDLAVLENFVDKNVRKSALSMISYTHAWDEEKAQEAADRFHFLKEAQLMILLENQRRFAAHLAKQKSGYFDGKFKANDLPHTLA